MDTPNIITLIVISLSPATLGYVRIKRAERLGPKPSSHNGDRDSFIDSLLVFHSTGVGDE